MKGENCGELLCLPDIDGALVGGASLDAEGFAAIVEAAAFDARAARPERAARAGGGTDRPRRLGDRTRRARKRDLARRHAGVRRAAVDVPARAADRVRACGRAARGSDGQLRGRTHEPRGRRGRDAGPDPDRRGRDQRWVRIQSRAPRGVLGRGARAPDRARVRRRRPLRLGAPRGVDPDGGHDRGSGPRVARVHRRPRHAAPLRCRLSGDGPGLDGGRRRRPNRVGGWSLLGHGSRQAMGPHAARVRPARARPCRAPRRLGGRGGTGGVRTRRDRRVHHPCAGR